MNALVLGYRRTFDPATGERVYAVDPKEAYEVEMAFKLVADGKSLRETAVALDGAFPRAWGTTMVHRALRREGYWKGKLAFIDPALARAAHRQLRKRRPKGKK